MCFFAEHMESDKSSVQKHFVKVVEKEAVFKLFPQRSQKENGSAWDFTNRNQSIFVESCRIASKKENVPQHPSKSDMKMIPQTSIILQINTILKKRLRQQLKMICFFRNFYDPAQSIASMCKYMA